MRLWITFLLILGIPHALWGTDNLKADWKAYKETIKDVWE